MDFHEESMPISDIVKTGSSSISPSDATVPKQTASEQMVLLVKKPKEERVDSDEEVFPSDNINTREQITAGTSDTSDIPIACVYYLIYSYSNMTKTNTLPQNFILYISFVYSVLPQHCEVNDPKLQDAFLVSLGFYDGLPPLRYVFLY